MSERVRETARDPACGVCAQLVSVCAVSFLCEESTAYGHSVQAGRFTCPSCFPSYAPVGLHGRLVGEVVFETRLRTCARSRLRTALCCVLFVNCVR